MKKTISVLLAIVMVFSLMPMTVFAATTDPTISFVTNFTEDMTIGNTFTVTAKFANNPGIATMTISLDWDDDVVNFTGFEMDDEGYPVTDVFKARNWTVHPNDKVGKIVAYRNDNKEDEGIIFVANFEIIGSGDANITYKNTDQSEFQVRNAANDDVAVNIDTSAISNLSVAGAGNEGAAIPDGAPFTAITTDDGPAINIERITEYDVESDDGTIGFPFYNSHVPYYHVIIPAGAKIVYVTDPNQTVGEEYGYDGTYEGTVAHALYAKIDNDWEGITQSFNYEMNGNAVEVFIPMEMEAVDYNNNVTRLCFAGDKENHSEEDEKPVYVAYAGQTVVNGYTYLPTYLLTFEYGTASEGGEEVPTYNITVEQPTGGTVAVYNEDNDEITEAAANEYVLVQVTPDYGYEFKYVTVNGEATNLENGFFKMPAKAVTVSAVFEEIHTCEFTDVTAEGFLKQAATCQSGAVYYKSCTCGAKNEATFTSGDPVGCVYENGTCKWCGTAEPVVTPGFCFATSADVSAENGGTAVVHVKITGHSNPDVNKYNAYDITLTYDSEKLKYAGFDGAVKSDNGRVEVDEVNGTIRIVGCGADKGFNTEIAALTFKTKAEGAANVTISRVQVSDKNESVKEDVPEATPKHDDSTGGEAGDATPSQSVIVVPYTVTKPGFISGNDKILHGNDYTFSYSDTDNYTYSGLAVTVGGAEVENLTADESGVYTIKNVTGAIEITATQTPNSYDVYKSENVDGPDKATYGENYEFTVTIPEGKEIESVTVTKTADSTAEIRYTIDDAGKYVIAGTDITGNFTITATVKDMPAAAATIITFTGVEASEVEGGLSQSAPIGRAFPFKLNKVEGFDYTVKVGQTDLTETDGIYTIPAELVVEGGVTVTIKKVDISTASIDVTSYIDLDGKTMFLVTAKWGDRVLAYGEGNTMFWSDKYTVTGEEEAGAYCWLVVSTDGMDLVKAAAEEAIAEAPEGVTATNIGYDYDINETTQVDVNDAQLAYDMYNASYMEFSEDLPMLKFLEADMKNDGKLDTNDVAAIINHIVNPNGEPSNSETPSGEPSGSETPSDEPADEVIPDGSENE